MHQQGYAITEAKTELEKTKTFIQLIYIFVPNVTTKDKKLEISTFYFGLSCLNFWGWYGHYDSRYCVVEHNCIEVNASSCIKLKALKLGIFEIFKKMIKKSVDFIII